MPEMGPPQQQQPAAGPAQGGGQGGGGGVAEKLVALDKDLYQIVSVVSQAPVSDGVKQAFQQALETFRSGMEALMAEAQGGGQGGQPGTVTPEQGGAAGAQPMSPAGPRGR